ncbi:MAG: PIG-L family deacetylase [Planctomycetota bacterium]|jgi:bacillithiol biosynthesis deacetylase BshB1
MAKIMAIGAHPDDIEIGCGATIHRLIKEKHDVVCVDLTDGEPTPHGTIEIRKAETEAANNELGIKTRYCLNLPNRVLMDTEDARMKLAVLMRKHQTEIILGHIELDAHPDHAAAFNITRGAELLSRIVKIDLDYEPNRPKRIFHFLCSHLRHAYQPSFVVPAREDSFNAKISAIRKYQSQFYANKDNSAVEDMLSARMKYFGSLARQPYGEGFITNEPVCVHNLLDII